MAALDNGPPVLRIRGWEIYSQGIRSQAFRNLTGMAEKAGITRSTASVWANSPESVGQLDLDAFTRLLTDALGLEPDEVLDLRLGDVFQFKVPAPEAVD
jgi:hypothetical protein